MILTNMKIGYARVSTRDQNLDMQFSALKNAGCEKIFSEKKSGIKERPVLQEAIDFLREGDCLVIYKFDRLGRSLRNLIEIIDGLNKRNIAVFSIMDNIDTSSPSGKLMMHIFAALAEFERDLIIERTQGGRKEAMKKGKKFGRPSGLPLDKMKACADLYKAGNTIKAIQAALNVKSKSTIYRWLEAEGIALKNKRE